MARYNLYVRDLTYVAIVQEGAKTGKSFGKLVNEILDNYVLGLGYSVSPNFCETCLSLSSKGKCTNKKSKKFEKFVKFKGTCDHWKKKKTE